MKDIEEASDRALKGIETILPLVVEKFIAVWICCAPFDLILQAWCAMNRTRKGKFWSSAHRLHTPKAMNRTHKKWYAKAKLVSAVGFKTVCIILSETVRTRVI